jgi:hypothetical protein
MADLLALAAAERIPRDPDGCLRCDGPLNGQVMFCAWCQSELERKAE